MLHQVLYEVEHAHGPVLLTDLSRKLGLAPSALQGMLEFWVRKGRLRGDGDSAVACTTGSSHCGSGCGGSDTCAFVAKMPRSYTVSISNVKTK